jgi:alpha-ribazole phosphatase
LSRIILVRHGDTAADSGRRYWGKTDVALSEEGLRQAERLRDRLAAEKIDVMYSSTLQRARITAATIASKHDLPVTFCPEIDEMNFGELEGLTWSEISERYPDFTAQWEKQLPPLRWPGGESIEEIVRRVGVFAESLKQHADGETALVVAHSGTLRTLICHLMGIDPVHRRQLRTDMASISILENHLLGANLLSLNDKSHLDGV